MDYLWTLTNEPQMLEKSYQKLQKATKSYRIDEVHVSKSYKKLEIQSVTSAKATQKWRFWEQIQAEP